MDSIEGAAILISCASAFALTGVIWVVQLVHYPMFAFVDRARALESHEMHTRRIAPIVAPLMVLELSSVSALAVLLPKDAPFISVYVGLGMIAVIWVSTFLLQVPLHKRLSEGFDENAVRRLVATNWIRTAAWSVRSALSLHLLWSLVGSRL